MKRQITYGTLTLISIAVFGMILIFLNAIPRSVKVLNVFGTRIPLQAEWDMTTNKRYTLSEQSIKTVRNLPAPVQAVAFAPMASPDHQQMETLLKRYAMQSPQFTFRLEDAEKNPLFARKYGIKASRSLILESKGQRETINLPFANDDAQAEARITAGLMRIANPKPAVLYFTRGHGEREVDDASDMGLSHLKSILDDENYTVKSFFLHSVKSIPDDATAVVVAGLTRDLFKEEIKILDAYLKRGGRILWMIGIPLDRTKEYKFPLVQEFLASQGIELQNGLLVSAKLPNLPTKAAILMPIFERFAPSSPITQGFQNRDYVFLPFARAVKAGKSPAGATVEQMMWTNKLTFDCSDPMRAAQAVLTSMNPAAGFNPKVDKEGEACGAVSATYPVTLGAQSAPDPSPAPAAPGAPSASPLAAASAAPGAASPDASPAASPATSPSPAAAPSAAPSPGASPSPAPGENKSEARMVVIGSSDFATKGLITYFGNQDLTLNTIAWLAQRTEQISISRPSSQKKPLSIDDQQKNKLIWFAFAVVPLMTLILGIFVHVTFKRH